MVTKCTSWVHLTYVHPRIHPRFDVLFKVTGKNVKIQFRINKGAAKIITTETCNLADRDVLTNPDCTPNTMSL